MARAITPEEGNARSGASGYEIVELGPLSALSSRRGFAPGKFFAEAMVSVKSMGLSVNAVKPGWVNPVLHRHQDHEELYVIVKGKGEMRLGETTIPVKEGDVIRVDPPTIRAMRNPKDATEELWFVCVRSSVGPFDPGDGEKAGYIMGVDGWSFDKVAESHTKK